MKKRNILLGLVGLCSSQELPKLKSSMETLPEGDENLQKMVYKGQETWVYVEPNVTSFYRASSTRTKVRPLSKGLSTKFINLSNEHLELYWVSGSRKHLMRSYSPFVSGGTTASDGHTFVLTSPGNPNDVKTTFRIGRPPNNVYYYDPYHVSGDPKRTETNLSVLSSDQLHQYHRWRETLDFHEHYKAVTGRAYLANYPRAQPLHFQWPAQYFDQMHWVETRETHFTEIPPGLTKLSKYSANHVPQLTDFRQPETLNLTLRALSCEPRVFEVPNFLSTAEVQHILHRATGLKLSTTGLLVGTDEKPKVDQLKTRTSSNTWVAREADMVMDAIYRRAADLMRIDEAWLRARHPNEHPEHQHRKSLAESLQLVHYTKGKEYTAHHDFGFAPITDEYQTARFATLLLYLNEGMEGGETSFPRWANAETFHELKVTPKVGKAILFYSQLPDGNLDDLSQHAAKPIVSGEKWLANLWTWA